MGGYGGVLQKPYCHLWPNQLVSLGVSGGSSQSFPYNPNDIYIDGGVRRVWSLMDNVNEGVEQNVQSAEPEKLPTVDEVKIEVQRLVQETSDDQKMSYV